MCPASTPRGQVGWALLSVVWAHRSVEGLSFQQMEREGFFCFLERCNPSIKFQGMSSRWINRNHTPDCSLHVVDDNMWGFLCEMWTLSVVFHPGWLFIFFFFPFFSLSNVDFHKLCKCPVPLTPTPQPPWIGAILGHAYNLILLITQGSFSENWSGNVLFSRHSGLIPFPLLAHISLIN